jgi:hypothetical protein
MDVSSQPQPLSAMQTGEEAGRAASVRVLWIGKAVPRLGLNHNYFAVLPVV